MQHEHKAKQNTRLKNILEKGARNSHVVNVVNVVHVGSTKNTLETRFLLMLLVLSISWNFFEGDVGLFFHIKYTEGHKTLTKPVFKTDFHQEMFETQILLTLLMLFFSFFFQKCLRVLLNVVNAVNIFGM